MSTLANRDKTALILVDVQNGVVAHAHQRDAVIATLRTLLARARAEGVAVVWVQHSSEELREGSDAWRIVPELVPGKDEVLIPKKYGDAFEGTRLASVLAELNVGRLVVAGAQTDACIRSTLHGAFVRGYDVFLVKDAHTTEDLSAWGAPPPEQVIAHTNLYWSFQSAPGRKAGVVAASDVNLSH